ncbi:Flp pilus assembly complex ATPase component TadA [Thermoleophilia bacterium SCSIO 60948]|nr:Flp pilus assembly complex ATPase component TadA [Thermoleophilia bacterium SCSIO 60948]
MAPAARTPIPDPSGLTEPLRSGSPQKPIGQILVELGYVTREQMEAAVADAQGGNERLGDHLVRRGFITGDQLSRAVAERYGLRHVDLTVYHVDMGAANLLTATAAQRYRAIPVGYLDPKRLLVATADPGNVIALDDIKMITGLACEIAVAVPEDIENLIRRLNTLETAVTEAIEEGDDGAIELDDVELRESAEDAPVIRLVYSILGQAASEGASDVHFEPEADDMRVRFRVDGILMEAARVPKRMVAGVVSRIKIMSELDIAEKRIPQDGRVSVDIEGRQVDLRVTTLPTQRGEGATIRLLDKEQSLLTLDELGMDGSARSTFGDAFRQAYGAVLVTGPTGSGKSTTLYGALGELNAVEKKIITIEDPVEYRIAGINQMNVNRKAGLSFAAGLRSMLRADPDVIMVGEIRDAETARIAIEAALTGHMVLSTLHTNDAPGTITRLAKMGIESFLTASALDCVVAQRLARKLCEHCKRATMVPGKAMSEAGFNVPGDIQAFEPVGCTRCNRTGFRGRVGLFSVMQMSERIKERTVSGASHGEISRVAREEGMLSLRDDGMLKVRAGVTSIAEVARVAS